MSTTATNVSSQLGWIAISIGPTRKSTIPRPMIAPFGMRAHGTRAHASRCRPLGCRAMSDQMTDPATRTLPALKEWALVCERLLEGTQAIMLRKGGINEKGFWVEADE